MILIHSDESVWTGLVFQLDFDAQTATGESHPHSYHAVLQSFDFSGLPPSAMFRRIWIEPNDDAKGTAATDRRCAANGETEDRIDDLVNRAQLRNDQLARQIGLLDDLDMTTICPRHGRLELG